MKTGQKLISVGVIATAAILADRECRDSRAEERTHPVVVMVAGPSVSVENRGKLLPVLPVPERGIDGFVFLFGEAKLTLNGGRLEEKNRELARLAVRELGCSNALLRLRQELYEMGMDSSVIQDLVNGALVDGLPDELSSFQMQQWADLEDRNIRADLAGIVGQKLTEEKLNMLLAMDDVDSGSAEGLVAGYSEKLSQPDPVAGVQFYLGRFPEGFRIHGLLDRLPPTAPFPGILQLMDPGSGEISDTKQRSLINRWAEIHPAQAAEYVAGNLERVNLRSAEALINQWGKVREALPASEWTASLPSGPVRDKCAQLLAWKLSKSHPPRAWEMAALIAVDHNGGKTKLLQRVYDIWVSTDPESADRALDALAANQETR